MDLNKHIVNTDSMGSIHSNGMAKIINGDRLGSVSKMTFSQRQQIDKNRRIIYGYHRSTLANSHRDPKNRIFKPIETEVDETIKMRQSNISQPRTNVQTKRYNPYA